MECPALCKKEFKKSIIYNTEINHCPSCRGIWLNTGQLDSIIENATY